MNIIELILASVGQSLDIYAVTVCEGATYANMNAKKVLNISFVFAGIQTAFLLIGTVISMIPVLNNENQEITKLNSLISISIFILLGLNMTYKAFYKKELREERTDHFNYVKISLLALATGLDTVIMGIGQGILGTKALFSALVMFITAWVCSVSGLQSGYYLGFGHRKGAYIAGGAMLIIIGIDVTVRYL